MSFRQKFYTSLNIIVPNRKWQRKTKHHHGWPFGALLSTGCSRKPEGLRFATPAWKQSQQSLNSLREKRNEKYWFIKCKIHTCALIKAHVVHFVSQVLCFYVDPLVKLQNAWYIRTILVLSLYLLFSLQYLLILDNACCLYWIFN